MNFLRSMLSKLKSNKPQQKRRPFLSRFRKRGRQQKKTPEEMLGFKAFSWRDRKSSIALAPLKKEARKYQRSITYHDKPPAIPIETIFVHDYLEDFTLLVRSVPKNVQPFFDLIEKARKQGNAAYNKFLDNWQEAVLPYWQYDGYDGGNIYGRDFLIWGLADGMIPSGKEPSASLYGKIPSFSQAGCVIHSVLHRLPMRQDKEGNLDEHRLNPCLYAAPSLPGFRHRCLVIENRAFAFWKGILEPRFLYNVLNLEVDIWLHAETFDKPDRPGEFQVYATTVLRTSSEIVNGKTPKIDKIERQLRKVGNWRRITGAKDIETAYYALIPGSEPPSEETCRRWGRHFLQEPPRFFSALVSRTDKTDSIEGNLYIGRRGGKPIFIDSEYHLIATGVVGPMGRGKTTYTAGVLGLQRTPNILLVQLSTARGEGGMTWAKDFGGDILEKELPDVVKVDVAPKEELGHEELVKRMAQKQKGWMLEDELEAIELVKEMAQTWADTDRPIGLPLVIRPKIESLRYWHFCQVFLHHFSLAWENWAVVEDEDPETGEKVVIYKDECIVIIDDFASWPGKEKSFTFGDIPVQIGMAAHAEMQSALTTYRKRGMDVIFTSQNETHFEKHIEGFLGSCTMLVKLERDKETKERQAFFFLPSQKPPVLFAKVGVELHPAVLKSVSRLEDRR